MDILIMGNTLFHFEPAFQDAVPIKLRDPNKRHSEYPHGVLLKVLTTPGFFLSIPGDPKAIEAIKELLDLGHNVKVCNTTLLPDDNPEGYLQQAQVGQKEFTKRFGAEFARHFFRNRVIMTRDRTQLKADILISDDEQTGEFPPEWELVIHDTPYNQNLTGYRRLTWDNWRETLHV